MVLVDSCTLALTEQFFDAALSELSVVARGQLCLMVGDFNVEPTKIPCLAKGFRLGSGLTLRKPGLWLLVCNQLLLVSVVGLLLVVIVGTVVGCPLAAAAVLSCRIQPDRWIALILLLGLFLIVAGGLPGLLSLFRVLPMACLLVACYR